jgi:signal transduction histidine kinase
MVTRRSAPESGGLSTEERLRESLAELETEVEELRRKLADQLAIGRGFLSDAAHAIRSPLTVTHSYLEILHTDLSDGLSYHQLSFLGIAHENVVKLRRLVEDLVDLAALETGTAQIELNPAAADRVIDVASAEIFPVAEEKGLEITSEVSDDLPTVMVDEDRFGDVVRRLLENAIRFTPDGGTVRIRTVRDRDHVIVAIEDTGVGIPADRIGEVFQPFVQLHRKPGENRESYGLGLALCRRQIEAFGGTLEIESSEGQGTTATIRIPVSENK